MSISDDSHLTPVIPIDNAIACRAGRQRARCPRRLHRLPRKADNTIRRQAADLARFVEFLNQVGERRCGVVTALDALRTLSERSRHATRNAMALPFTRGRVVELSDSAVPLLSRGSFADTRRAAGSFHTAIQRGEMPHLIDKQLGIFRTSSSSSSSTSCVSAGVVSYC